MFYPLGGGATTFKFPEERKLRIEGCAMREDLANPAEFDPEGQQCLMPTNTSRNIIARIPLG